MSAFIPGGATQGSAVDLACTRSCPTWFVMSVCEGFFFLITRGRGDASLDGISVTVVRCMGRGGTTTAGAAGTRTRVRAGGRQFSFPLTLLAVVVVMANFFGTTGWCEILVVTSPEVLFSVCEKLFRALDSRRRDGCRAGGGGPRELIVLCGCGKESESIFARPS